MKLDSLIELSEMVPKLFSFSYELEGLIQSRELVQLKLFSLSNVALKNVIHTHFINWLGWMNTLKNDLKNDLHI